MIKIAIVIIILCSVVGILLAVKIDNNRAWSRNANLEDQIVQYEKTIILLESEITDWTWRNNVWLTFNGIRYWEQILRLVEQEGLDPMTTAKEF